MITMADGGAADQREALAAKYGFWADERTFILDPPRRHLSERGVSIVRRLIIDAGALSDADALSDTLRMIRSTLVLDMVAHTESAADLTI